MEDALIRFLRRSKSSLMLVTPYCESGPAFDDVTTKSGEPPSTNNANPLGGIESTMKVVGNAVTAPPSIGTNTPSSSIMPTWSVVGSVEPEKYIALALPFPASSGLSDVAENVAVVVYLLIEGFPMIYLFDYITLDWLYQSITC